MEETGKGICSKLKVNFMAAKPIHSSDLDMIQQVGIPEGNSPKEVFFFLTPPPPFALSSSSFWKLIRCFSKRWQCLSYLIL